ASAGNVRRYGNSTRIQERGADGGGGTNSKRQRAEYCASSGHTNREHHGGCRGAPCGSGVVGRGRCCIGPAGDPVAASIGRGWSVARCGSLRVSASRNNRPRYGKRQQGHLHFEDCWGTELRKRGTD